MRRVSCWAALGLAAGAFLTVMSGTAAAQTSVKQPIVDSAPARVGYARAANIAGHLDGWTAGDEVSLQRRRGDSWQTVGTKVVDEQGAVRFWTAELYRTAGFRLRYVDPATESQTVSDTAKVAVRPKLSLVLSKRHVMTGRTLTAHGQLLPRAAARPVVIQQRARGRWRTLDTVYARDGRYTLRFDARRVGFHPIRAVFRGDSSNLAAREKAPLGTYDPAPATWYGPGFYGNRTACGQTLTTNTVGVAHRTLPCGTKISILFEGRTIVVPVIDRGPYSHADWDLTEEAAQRLRFSGTDTIGVVRSN